MKKKRISFNYSTDIWICQWVQRHGRGVGCVFGVVLMSMLVLLPVTASAAEYTDGKGVVISDNCEAIKNDLKILQRNDSKARLYLGGKYETMLTKYVKVLNVKLVENNRSDIALLENQSQLVKTKAQFVDDFVEYQRGLEELIMVDCKAEPKHFYEKLEQVRTERAKVKADVVGMDGFLSKHIKIIETMVGDDDATAE